VQEDVMIEKIVSSAPVTSRFQVTSHLQNEAFSSYVRQSLSTPSLPPQPAVSALEDTLSLFANTLVPPVPAYAPVQPLQAVADMPVTLETILKQTGSQGASSGSLAGNTALNLKEVMYFGAEKPPLYYYVPDKLWQAVVTTPDLKRGIEAFDGLPAIFELPKWEVETGYGVEPRFKRVDVNERTMLTYDYPGMLEYAIGMLKKEHAAAADIAVLNEVMTKIQNVLDAPLSDSTRPSEAYYAARVLALFGEEELYATFLKSIQSYVNLLQNRLSYEDQMAAFGIPTEFKEEYTTLAKDPVHKETLTQRVEETVRERTTNYPKPPVTFIAPETRSRTTTQTPPVVTAETSPQPQPAEPESGRPLTSREKLVLFGTFHNQSDFLG
jgi:hypothetical protein